MYHYFAYVIIGQLVWVIVLLWLIDEHLQDLKRGR